MTLYLKYPPIEYKRHVFRLCDALSFMCRRSLMNRLHMKAAALICLLFSIQTHLYADYLEVTLLGTGTPRPNIERFGAATLVQAGGHNFLFDAGRGTTIRLQQAGLTPNMIDKVFLTHLHSDHISGLDDLWITGWVWQRKGMLNVVGPRGTHQLIAGLREAYASDIAYRTENVQLDSELANINGQEVLEDVVFQQDSVTIRSFLVEHAPVKPALGYRIEFGDRVVVISGDTTYSENLIKHAQDADVLIHEITAALPSMLERNQRLEKIVAYHTTPQQMVQVLNKTKPRLAILYHVLLFGVPEQKVLDTINTNYSGDVIMGYDLMQLGVGDSIRIKRLNQINK